MMLLPRAVSTTMVMVSPHLLALLICLIAPTQGFLPSASTLSVPSHSAWCAGKQAFGRSLTLTSTRATGASSSARRRRRPKDQSYDCSMSVVVPGISTAEAAGGVETRIWTWRGYDIRYKVAGKDMNGPAMVLIHGFGGNADHWRKSMATLAKTGPVYAIDLLGYGFSSKPDPGPWEEKNSIYNFHTWSDQVLEFAKEVVGDKVFVVCNSVGGLAGLQAAVDAPDQVMGVVLFNISLRMLHTTKQPALGRPFVTGLQYVLRETPVGSLFFGSVAKSKAVSNILKQCYGDPAQVTDELVECILTPGLEPGAVKVFLDFLSYSSGPLPEDLLDVIKVPVVIGWGDQDPWEPIDQGMAYKDFDSVEDFVVLPGAGHCPMDEAPQLTDPVIVSFVEKHAKPSTAT